jgi:hypothetical protein
LALTAAEARADAPAALKNGVKFQDLSFFQYKIVKTCNWPSFETCSLLISTDFSSSFLDGASSVEFSLTASFFSSTSPVFSLST